MTAPLHCQLYAILVESSRILTKCNFDHSIDTGVVEVERAEVKAGTKMMKEKRVAKEMVGVAAAVVVVGSSEGEH